MKPWELERLQCHELETLFDGYRLREDRDNARMAYFTYWIVMPHVRKGKLSLNKILKPIIGKKEKRKRNFWQKKNIIKIYLGREVNKKWARSAKWR